MDVFLGRNGAGIAYYEKSGADLRITLLDQQEVLVRNFFAIGANGEYSRLLKTQNGEVEVSGLIAPEPFVARDAAPIVAQADAPAVAAPVAATSAPAEVAPAPAPAPAPVITAAAGGVDADGAGEGGTFSLGWDTGAFFAVNGLILLRALDSGSSNSDGGGAPAADAPAADAPAADAQTAAAAAPAADPAPVATAAAPVSLMSARFASVALDADDMNADDAALLAGMADEPAAQADDADVAALASLGLGGAAADAGADVLGATDVAADAVVDVPVSTVPLDDLSNPSFVI